jgi:small subunit ribosomal protein S17
LSNVTSAPDPTRGARKSKVGRVASNAMRKTIVVVTEMQKAHATYGKTMRRSSRFLAHDEANAAGVGDLVRIIETRPISARKRWRLVEILEKAK